MEQTITDFLNTDYKSYARYVVESRAIPHFADGLKPSQRKALAAGIRFCSDRTMKVSALGGQVMAAMDYHHGDSSIQGAIIAMSQEFNCAMPYFDRVGQFGWLYDKTAGAPRYISVKLSGWSKLLLKDEAELHYNLHEDTGERIEPRYYLPILPMLLINGTNGIAVGYSTSFINRNPLEVALATREYIATGAVEDYKLAPFVNGHTGVWSYWNGQFEHCAPWSRKNSTVLRIEGLPINTTLEKYRGFLNILIDQGFIKRWSDLSSKGTTIFEVHMTQQALDKLIADNGVPGMFNLVYRLPQDNLTCIMPDNSIRRFDSPMQVVREFADFRIKFYSKRKKRLHKELQSRIAYLDSLIRFIDLVLAGAIDFRNITKLQLEQFCDTHQIDRSVINVAVYNLTADNRTKHCRALEALHHELAKLDKTTEQQMYLADLDEVIMHLRKFYKIEKVLNLKQEWLPRPEMPTE